MTESAASRPTAAVRTALPDRTQSARLVIRAWQPDDADALHEAIVESVEHLRPWMPWAEAEPLSVDDRRRMIGEWHDTWASGGDVVFGLFAGDRAIGGSGLHRRGPDGTLEIGYWVRASEVRKGYCAEAADAIAAFALTVPGIERVTIHHDRANVASAGVARSAGFTFVREVSDEVTAPGEEGVDWEWERRA